MREIVTLIALSISIASFLCTLLIYGKLHNEVIDAQDQVKSLEYTVEETEARCERMTDTCIDIVANGRWQ